MWRDRRSQNMFSYPTSYMNEPVYRRFDISRRDPSTSLIKRIEELSIELKELELNHNRTKTVLETQNIDIFEQLNNQILINNDLKNRIEKLERIVKSPHVVDIEELEEQHQEKGLGIDSEKLLVRNSVEFFPR